MAMQSGIGNIGRLPELRKKVIWTFILLAVYRLGVYVPIPGVDAKALADFFASAQNTDRKSVV